jgi:branched-chain amino acid transport system substrate-binding protein
MRGLLAATSLAALITTPGWADNLQIGMITTLSGPGGYLGEQIRDGFQLRIDMEGGSLGGVPVELIVEDDGLNPGQGRQIAEKYLVDMGIQLVTGIVFSNVAGAVVPEVVDSGAFYISPNAGPSNLAGAECHENYFVVSWQNDSLHEATGAAAKSLGFTKALALAPNYQAGRDSIEGFKRLFEGEVTEIYTQLEQTDFAAEMAQIRAANPEVVFQFHPGGLGLAFMRQYAQAGLLGTIPQVVSAPNSDPVLLQALGDAAIGLVSTTHWNADFDNAASQEFVAAWQEKFADRPVTIYAQQAYDTALLISAALAETGGLDDGDAFREALRTVDWDSTRGDFEWGPNQHPLQNWYLVEVVAGPDGKPVAETREKLRDMVGDVHAAQCNL